MLNEHLDIFYNNFQIVLPKRRRRRKRRKEKKDQNAVAFNPTNRKILDHIFYSTLRVTENTNKKYLVM